MPYVIVAFGATPFSISSKVGGKEEMDTLALSRAKVYSFELCNDGKSFLECSLVDILTHRTYDVSELSEAQVSIDLGRLEFLRIQYLHIYEVYLVKEDLN